MSFIRNHQRSDQVRFAKKILNDFEIIQFQNTEHPKLFLWMCWALKESAYKIYIKAGGIRRFNPKYFNTGAESISQRSFFISLGKTDTKYEASLSLTNNYIHAIASTSPHKFTSGITYFKKSDPTSQSLEVRKALIDALKNRAINATVQNSIVGNHPYIPEHPELDVSLSHCKNWGSWVITDSRLKNEN